MGADRRQLRGIVLAEDRRTERFIRHLLDVCGFDKRKFRFHTAPGQGSGEAWVRVQYPGEVKLLRAKVHQRLCLVAICDGDALGVEARKAQLDEALRQADLQTRAATERIATPVPTWAIENWLLDLLGEPNINEAKKPSTEAGPTWKQLFERAYGADEKGALTEAANRWDTANPRLPSLENGRVEFERIDQ